VTTTTTVPVVTIDKSWDGNERITEGRNGRTYVSAGRWQWIVLVDGAVESAHTTQREAKHRRSMLTDNDECPMCSNIGRGPLCKDHRPTDDGHQHEACHLCGVDCSTHPDAANPLASCGDCGRPTCPDHRVDDAATRCNECAATFYGTTAKTVRLSVPRSAVRAGDVLVDAIGRPFFRVQEVHQARRRGYVVFFGDVLSKTYDGQSAGGHRSVVVNVYRLEGGR
jgi:hypothetical protein